MAVVESLRDAEAGDTVSIWCPRSGECTGKQRLVKEVPRGEDFIVSPNERQFSTKCCGCHKMGRGALPPRSEPLP